MMVEHISEDAVPVVPSASIAAEPSPNEQLGIVQEPRRRSRLIIGLSIGTVVALVFAIVGLTVGLTKGSPDSDTRRATALQTQLADARTERVSAVSDAHAAAARAETFRAKFDQMLSFAEQMHNVAVQQQVAGIAGNVALENQLVSQFGALVAEHNTATDQLSATPLP